MFKFERIFKYNLKSAEVTHCSVFPVAVLRGYNPPNLDSISRRAIQTKEFSAQQKRATHLNTIY
jgi:hypothetical protein